MIKFIFFRLSVIGILIFSSLLFALLSYGSGDKKMIKGKLYITISNKIEQIDLALKKEEEIYQGSNMRLFGDVTKRDNSTLFLALTNLGTGKRLITSFNLTTKDFTTLCEGLKPSYIPEITSVFYYKYKEGLFKKKLDESPEEFITDNIYTYSPEIQPNALYYPHPPVQISPSEIAYYTKDKKIEIYNFLNKTFKELDITGYEPWAYYKKKDSLICKNKSDNFLYSVNLSSLDKEKVNIKPTKRSPRCIIVVDDYDCLIYSKVRLPAFWGEMEDMYIYWIDEKKEQKYLKDTFIWSGVYVR